MTTTPTLFDGEQQVNTVGTGAQFGQKVVGLADGTSVVLWTSDADIGAGDDAGRDIIGQRFDAEGNKIGGEFQANRNFFADDESLLDAQALPNGNFVLVYEDRDASGVSYRFDILSPTGAFVDGGTILSDPGNGTNFGAASIAVAPDGSFMVAYDRGDGSTEVVRVDGAGNVGVPDIAITHNEGSSSTAITRLSNGNFVVVTEDGFQGDSGLAFRLVDAGGNALGAATPLANTRTNGDSDFRPAVTALTGGGFVASWVNIDANDNDLEFQVFDAAGNAVGGVRTVNSDGATDNNDDATMVALSDGGFVIGYTDDEDQSIKLQRYDANGDEVGTEATVTNAASTTFSNSPHIALSADGRLLVSWGFQDDAFDDNDIEVAILDPRENNIGGSNGADTITSRQDGASVKGFGGDDTLLGQNDDDTLDGGAGDDVLRGRSGGDTISGGEGDDLIEGGLNGDKLSGDEGDDRIFANTQADPDGSSVGDTMSGGLGDDTITGSDGDDVINGGAGTDQLRGGDDDDLYVVNVQDEAIEAANEGVDTVRSTVDYVLGANLENLVLLGNSPTDGTGNVGANRITGNGGANVIDGRNGDDVLTGGAGADRFVFSTALSAANNVDKITDFQVNVDEIRLDNAVFDALANGALANGAFRIGAAAADANDRIIYNDQTGALIYDANGSAAGGAVRFATLDKNLAVDAGDFFVV